MLLESRPGFPLGPQKLGSQVETADPQMYKG
jgi:hypothetical protein